MGSLPEGIGTAPGDGAEGRKTEFPRKRTISVAGRKRIAEAERAQKPAGARKAARKKVAVKVPAAAVQKAAAKKATAKIPIKAARRAAGTVAANPPMKAAKKAAKKAVANRPQTVAVAAPEPVGNDSGAPAFLNRYRHPARTLIGKHRNAHPEESRLPANQGSPVFP